MSDHPHQKHLAFLAEAQEFVAKHPELPIQQIGFDKIQMRHSYVASDEVEGIRREYRRVAKALVKIGRVEKFFGPAYYGSSDHVARLIVKISDNLTYEWECPRDSVCSKQKVVKEVEDWVCEPVLGPEDSD